MELIQCFQGQNSQKAVELLRPDIQIQFKEKVTPDQLPNDVVFHIR